MGRPLTYAALCVALLTAPACQSEPEPRFAPTDSPSPSAMSPTAEPDPDPLTPEETVRAWVDARNEALQDGDTSEMKAFHAANCPGVRQLRERDRGGL